MIQQAKLADVDWIGVSNWTFSRKGQLYVDDFQYALTHKKTNSIWLFSHSDMVLVGISKITGKPLGVLGKNGFLSDLKSVKTMTDLQKYFFY